MTTSIPTTEPTILTPEVAERDSSNLSAVGRRKSASARVRLIRNGSGKITVNKQVYTAYFTTFDARATCRTSLEVVGQADKLDVEARIVGGGINSQADALRLGIARALCLLNPTFQRALRKVGHLTRDARIKERKKPGLKKARRAPQWAKR
ncbi:MAG: 30S ribosomal protein S9 [bacterium]|nr:30S ribosomal protein S9 [bacterium]